VTVLGHPTASADADRVLAIYQPAGFRSVGIRERVARHTTQGNRLRGVLSIERRRPILEEDLL
jgi:hypothetical protein